MASTPPARGIVESTDTPSSTIAPTPMPMKGHGDDPETKLAAESIENIPRLAEAVRRKLEESLLKAKRPDEKKPLYMTLNVRGRALFDLAFILSKVPTEGKETQRTLELCDRAGVAFTMVRIIEVERDDGDGFAAKSAVLALSVLANLACINGHVQLLRPEINALELFLALLTDEDAQAESPLVLPYAIAGVRNLANQVGAAEQLRKSGGERLLRELIKRPDAAEILDEQTLVHATKALMLVNDLAQKATRPLVSRKKKEEEAVKRRKELEDEYKKFVDRRDAAVLLQRNVRRQQTQKVYSGGAKKAGDLEGNVGPSAEMLDIIKGLHDASPAERAKAVHGLATFAATCSSIRLAEVAVHADEIAGLLVPGKEPPSTQAYAACVLANLSYTRNGQRAAIRAGAVEALLGVLQSNVEAARVAAPADAAAARSARNAAMSQAAAALQNLTFELTPVCDKLVSLGAPGVLTALMASDQWDETCREYAAGVLTNLHVYATDELPTDAAEATSKARELIIDKHQRSAAQEEQSVVRIQSAFRGKDARGKKGAKGKG